MSVYGFLKAFGPAAFVVWLGLAFVAAAIAYAKGRSAIGHFFIAVLCTPLLGLVLIVCLPSLKVRRPPAANDAVPEDKRVPVARAQERPVTAIAAPADDDATGMPRIDALSTPTQDRLPTSKPVTLRDGSTEIRSWVARAHRSNSDGSSRQKFIEKLVHVGEEVEVAPEPNDEDPDAMAVIAVHRLRLGGGQERGKIGYLARDVASTLKTETARGGTVNLYVSELRGGTRDDPIRNVRLRAVVRPRAMTSAHRGQAQ